MKRYVDHTICEGCNGVHTGAYFPLSSWECRTTNRRVDRYIGTSWGCNRLRGHYLATVVRFEVCQSCPHYVGLALEKGPVWHCKNLKYGRILMAPWAVLPAECDKKMEHCVASAGEMSEDDFLKKDETNPP